MTSSHFDNPYLKMDSPLDDNHLDAFAIMEPQPNAMFDTEGLVNARFRARINTTQDLDLDRVNFSILVNGDDQNIIDLGGDPSFLFGGRTIEDVNNNANTYSPASENTGVLPGYGQQGLDDTGRDELVYVGDLSSLPDGDHIFSVQCWDIRQNDLCGQEQNQIAFTVQRCDPNQPDETPPEITILSSTQCLSATGNFSLCGKVDDNCSNPEQLTLNGEPVEFTSINSNTHIAEFCADVFLNEGSNSMHFQVADASGNVKDMEFDLNVDNTSPELLTVIPPDGSVNVPSNQTIQASFDEPLSSGEIDVTGGPITGNSVLDGSAITYVHGGLAVDTPYVANVNNVMDQCGNSGGGPPWSFTTAPFFARITSPDNSDLWQKMTTLAVQGEIRNPALSAEVTVIVSFAGSQLQETQNIPPGENNSWNMSFNLPAEEGTAAITMTAVYQGNTVGDSREIRIDNKLPTLAIGSPQNNSTVYDVGVLVNAQAEDKSSKLQSLTFGNAPPPNIQPDQQNATISGVHTGLVLGPNELTATVSDNVGNSTSTVITVNRSGSANWSLEVLSNECGGPADWRATVSGTPGFVAILSYKEPNDPPSQTTLTIGGSGIETKDYHGEDTGQYLFSIQIKHPVTQEIVLTDSSERSIGSCKYDPTFVNDPGIGGPPPENKPASLAFSPVSSPGVKDTFEKEYAVVFGWTTLDIMVHNQSGALVRTLVDAVKEAGLYTFVWDGRNTAGELQPEAPYTITIHQTDANAPANSTTESFTVAIDNTPPAISLDHLQGTEYGPRIFSVWGNLSDKNLESYTVYQVNGSTVTALQTVNSVVDCTGLPPGAPEGSEGGFRSPSCETSGPIKLGSIDATSWMAGGYYIRVEVKDSAGNSEASVE